MDPVDIDQAEGTRKVVFAENQPEYQSLPALLYPSGMVRSRWHFTPDERRAIADGADLELFVWTFNRPLQPVDLQILGVDSESTDPLDTALSIR